MTVVDQGLTQAPSVAEAGESARARGEVAVPRGTYRLQMHREFNFESATRIIPYLAALGVSHLYVSPIQTSQPGSMHGYDIVDHETIDPELGGLEGFHRFSDALKAAGLRLIVDIVPNHAGIGGSHNAWWLSVLEWGPLSPFAGVFDIDWERPGARGKLIAPFLGNPYGTALTKGEIRLAFDAKIGGFNAWHYEHQFPICPLHYPDILDPATAIVDAPEARVALREISEELRALATPADGQPDEAAPEKASAIKLRLAALAAREPTVAAALERIVANFNGEPGNAATFSLLHGLLERQAYRLSFWRVAESDLNYRRFFDINTLAGIRVEDPDVFERTHRLIFRLIAEKRIDGLRIDHVDGLADPEGYLNNLRGVVGPGFYVVVEKILEPGEKMRSWPVAGTTGYDALRYIDGLFVDGRSEALFDRFRRRYGGSSTDFHRALREIKAGMLRRSFNSEFETLVANLKSIADASPYTRDFTHPALGRVTSGMISRLPVYRSYLTEGEASPEDKQLLSETAAELTKSIEPSEAPALEFFLSVLLGSMPGEKSAIDADHLRNARRLFQQLSGPVMAKSLEDTLFYRYTRLVALNEVGGDPTSFGVTPADFHAANVERRRDWPHSMVATETHDSKRGEDMRARLVAISEFPAEWERIVELWGEVSNDGEGPDEADRYFMLQTIVGAWPLEMLEEFDADVVTAFLERLNEYFVKSLREAKRRSSWLDPDASYEDKAKAFVAAALSADGAFLRAAAPLVRKLAEAGMRNSLSRVVLKFTMPGVPDTYQGTEFWDFSLVDPDNRREVDYDLRSAGLTPASPLELLETWRDGRVKQALIARLLADRALAPELYASGDYRPLSVPGEAADHVIAYSRNGEADSRVVLAGRLLSGQERSEERLLANASLPIASGFWRDVVTDKEWDFRSGQADLGELLSPLAVSVLRPIQRR